MLWHVAWYENFLNFNNDTHIRTVLGAHKPQNSIKYLGYKVLRRNDNQTELMLRGRDTDWNGELMLKFRRWTGIVIAKQFHF